MPQFPTLDDVSVADKVVLVRGDLNVPAKDGTVTDSTRLDRLAPTLTRLADAGAKVVVLSHFGRPKGQRNLAFSLRPVAEALAVSVGRPVQFAEDCIGEPARVAIGALPVGGIVVLENLRFHPGEEKNDPEFAGELASLGDIYVNDAFSAAHRAHASTEGLAHKLPAAAGLLMQAELEALGNALEAPVRPVMAVVGGAKISTKLELLGNLVQKVDVLVLGGGMANTFLFASGTDVGASLCEKDMADAARTIMSTASEAGCEVMLPVDGLVAKEFKAQADHVVSSTHTVPADGMVLDIGPASIDRVIKHLGGMRTVVWNGPVGAFEIEPFDTGTTALAKAVGSATRQGTLMSVAGGGDTIAALSHAGAIDDFTYVSTAGGAFLEWLEGKTLPGVAALMR